MGGPYVLGIETATRHGGVAIADADGIPVSLQVNQGRSHSRLTTSLVKQATEIVGIAPRDLSAVGVSIGPGSFTGIRIGLSVAKGLCLAMERGKERLIGVSTLEALATRAASADGWICPILDARRDQVYAALFRSRGADAEALERFTEDSRVALTEWMDRIDSSIGDDAVVTFTGDSIEGETPEFIAQRLGPRARFASSLQAHPSPDAVARLAWRRHEANPDLGQDWQTLEPEYVRAQVARAATPPKHE